VSPIDYLCRDCGTSFEVGVGSLLSDDFEPGCPACESDQVETDWDAVGRRFGGPSDGIAAAPAGMTSSRKG
jgi:DNA-directed RNA polymerase subunit RPC12/RpoP